MKSLRLDPDIPVVTRALHIAAHLRDVLFGTLPEDEHPTIAVHPSPKTEKSFQRICFRYCECMFVRLGNCLLIVALITATGGHWAALQTIAWTNMLAENLRTASLEEALTKTFDGKHPCKFCKVIQKGRAEEKKQEQQQTRPITKMDLGLVWQSTAFIFDYDSELISSSATILQSRSESPPKPRPRVA